MVTSVSERGERADERVVRERVGARVHLREVHLGEDIAVAEDGALGEDEAGAAVGEGSDERGEPCGECGELEGGVRERSVVHGGEEPRRFPRVDGLVDKGAVLVVGESRAQVCEERALSDSDGSLDVDDDHVFRRRLLHWLFSLCKGGLARF